MPNRCLYATTFKDFLEQERLAVLGALHSNYHGDSLTTTDETWMGEIDILQQVLIPWKNESAQVIFEYEIPRLGKRIDVVLLLRGIIFCLEFKVGQKDVIQAYVEYVLKDYVKPMGVATYQQIQNRLKELLPPEDEIKRLME